MRLAIVAEKPSLLDAFAPQLPEFFPDVDFARSPVFFPIFGWYKGTTNRFRLPRGLKWSELPFTAEPAYRQISFGDARSVMGVRKLVPSTYAMIEAEAEQAIAECDVILLLVDACYGSAHLAYRFITDALGYFPKDRILYPWIVDLTENGRRKAMSEMRRFDEFAMPLVSMGETRRYFDFNYVANALPIIGDAARRAGVWRDDVIPSKYGLQFLYGVRETGALSEGAQIDTMSKWKGTGRYHTKDHPWFWGLASPTSRSNIIEELVKAHYLERSGSKRLNVGLSEEGARFLDLLHPDCEDKDLPFRLEQWSHLPEADAREKINRYIRTFFGKQKTFRDKARALEVAS